MGLKIYKPITPGLRKTSVVSFEKITKGKPAKAHVVTVKKKSGRNNTGKITVRHQGGGVRKKYRMIDFSQGNFFGKSGTVESVEYDPNRSAFIALTKFEITDNACERVYMIAPEGISVGDTVDVMKDQARLNAGSRFAISKIPPGTPIYNLEILPNSRGKLIRSAGTQGIILASDEKYVQIKLPSGEVRNFLPECKASIGSVSNSDHNRVRIGKAGRKRHMGIRPTVRGKAMNACDHPHGGGEGRNPIGLPFPKTKWGKIARGIKTRKKCKPSDKFIVERRRKKK